MSVGGCPLTCGSVQIVANYSTNDDTFLGVKQGPNVTLWPHIWWLTKL